MINIAPNRAEQLQLPGPLKLGLRAHDFGCGSADQLAERIATAGFGCVQLALNKAIAGLRLEAGDLTSGLAREIGHAFRRQGVEIAVLGCYINPIHPEMRTRARLLELFIDHLRLAREFGCGLVALESGSVNADYSPHPANQGALAFHELLASLEWLLAAAEAADVSVGLEAVVGHTVASATAMQRVLKTLGSRHLKVVLDPVNLLSAALAPHHQRILAEAIDLLGADIAVVHAKDFILTDGVLQTRPAGQGQLGYGPILEYIRHQAPSLPVLLEEASETTAPGCARYLKQRFEETIL